MSMEVRKQECSQFWFKIKLHICTANENDHLGWLPSPFSGSTSIAGFKLLPCMMLLRLLCLLAPRDEHTSRQMTGIFWGQQWPGYSTIQSCLGDPVLKSPITARHMG